MLFNNIDLTPYFRIKDIRGRGLPVRETESIYVPGMDGEYVSEIRTPGKYLEIDIRIIGKNLRETIDELSGLLTTDEAVPIEFPDEPDIVYWGLYEGAEEAGEKRHLRTHDATIYIKRSDPYKYGPEIDLSIPNFYTHKYTGTANAYPVLELTAKEASTFVLVQNQADTITLGDDNQPKYMLLGKPYNVDDHVFRRYERVFYTNANSLVGWANGSSSDIDGGVVGGKIVSSDNRFIVDSYGTGSQWHGPVIKTSIPEAIQDFRLSAYVGFLNKQSNDMVGRVEIYLLDTLGQAVCKMALKDTSAARANVWAEMRAGDRETGEFIINEDGSRPGVWNNFSGRLEISREGNKWSAWVGVRNSDGIYVKRRIVHEWIDFNNKHNRNVAQIVIHIGAVGKHKPVHARTGVSSIMLDKINQAPNGIPYIVEPGDVVRLDMKTGDAYINGVDANRLLAFGSDPFQLLKGKNDLVIHPDIFDSRIIYRNTYR